jgi:hypothetical protein
VARRLWGQGSVQRRGDAQWHVRVRFLLTATDGQVSGGGGTDKFRIKIWDSSSTTVCDNMLGAADDLGNAQTLASGTIVIHATK